jgi:hypothetical protein
MSPTTSKPARGRSKRGGKISKGDRRVEREVAAMAREARREANVREQEQLRAAARELRVQQEQAELAAVARRQRARRVILDLLRRGAGVTQILETLVGPTDTLSDSVRYAKQLRCILEEVGGVSDTAGLEIKPRKLARTLAHLDRELAWMERSANRSSRRYVSPLACAA